MGAHQLLMTAQPHPYLCSCPTPILLQDLGTGQRGRLLNGTKNTQVWPQFCPAPWEVGASYPHLLTRLVLCE